MLCDYDLVSVKNEIEPMYLTFTYCLCLGIDRLLSDGVFTAAFPLHDGPYKSSKDLKVGDNS